MENQMETTLNRLEKRGVIIPHPQQIYIGDEVNPQHIEAGVVLKPGIVVEGQKTSLGTGTVLGPGGHFVDVRCGRGVKLASGSYTDCVFLDGTQVRSGAEIRGGTLFMENTQAAHTVGCKMTILGINVTLGSLINFCDIFVSGGTALPFDFTEIGSGAIHYNFTPNGLKFASIIGPGTPGEMFGLFPRSFIGGQTQIIAPTLIGCNVLIPAGNAVRSPVADGVISVQPALTSGQKPHHPALIAHVEQKLVITATVIAHYRSLVQYFVKARMAFACHIGDVFLQALYSEAIEMIECNMAERISWLFNKQESGQRVDFFSKLPLSLQLHRNKLLSSPQTAREIEEIQEHQVLLQEQKTIERALSQPIPDTHGQTPFLDAFHNALRNTHASSYFQFLSLLGQDVKSLGKKWLEETISEQISPLTTILHTATHRVEITRENDRILNILRPSLAKLSKLYQDDKLLISGDFNETRFGILNLPDLDECKLAWKLLGNISGELAEKFFLQVLDVILQIPFPVAVRWPDLWEWIVGCSSQDIESVVMRSCFRLHGTDGLRGTMLYPNREISLQESIAEFLFHHEITPVLLEGLARNTVYAWEICGNAGDTVVIGRDTRDLYMDDPKRANLFYEAIQRGVRASGVNVLDLEIVPVAHVPYFMAHYYIKSGHNSHTPTLALYKTASHNPASQDGIKVFVSPRLYKKRIIPQEASWKYQKASVDLEIAISALMLKEAITGPKTRPDGIYKQVAQEARNIFGEMVSRLVDTLSCQKVAFLAVDMAHGAFAQPHYQRAIDAALHKCFGENLILVGNNPNGKNINNNEGSDRVGAAHLENVHEISRQDISPGGNLAGFPALSALWSFGQSHRSRLQEGDMAWSIFTDGDGDRGYAAFYNPHEDRLDVVDGEKAFFYLIEQSAVQGKLRPGDLFTFSVESSIPFINALIASIEKVHPVHLILSDDTHLASDKINLKITPVGDKYILANQAPGVESCGHIVAPYWLQNTDYPPTKVLIGNGLLAMIQTIAACDFLLCQPSLSWTEKSSPDEFRNKIESLAHPYARPYNTTVYIYFVARKLWYRGSYLWRELEKMIEQNCGSHSLTRIDFPEEPDTLYEVCLDENQTLRFAILARLSGTENKMNIKFYGTPDTQELFTDLSEKSFEYVAPRIKDPHLQTYQDQLKILRTVADEKEPLAIEHVISRLVEENRPRAYWMMIVGSLANQGEKLVHYDGIYLKMSERGRNFCQKLDIHSS